MRSDRARERSGIPIAPQPGGERADKAHRCWSAESCSSAPCANARRRSRRPSAFASSGWIDPITMVMPLVAASALSIEVPDSALRHSTHAVLLNPISPISVCPSGRSSARSEASPPAHRQPHTILNTRPGMVREVRRDTNKHDREHPVVASCTIERAQPSDRSPA